MSQPVLLSSVKVGLIFLTGVCLSSTPGALGAAVDLQRHESKVVISVGGTAFAEYHFRDVPRPFLYPVHGPSGVALTRNWPMKEVPGEDRDHPHHRGLWFTHGDVNGQDFWSESPKAGKIVHKELVSLRSGDTVGELTARSEWVAQTGQVICSDTTRLQFRQLEPHGRAIDFEVTLQASQGDLTLGDTKEGSMAIRIAETMRLKQPKDKPPGLGHILNSEGARDAETWGKRARWCHYSGPAQGKTVGVAIFDHPSNTRHPTWWHVRDYGLFAANPFGIHDFEKKPAGTGNLVVPSGQSLTFRYRFYFHDGDHSTAQLEQLYRAYLQTAGKP